MQLNDIRTLVASDLTEVDAEIRRQLGSDVALVNQVLLIGEGADVAIGSPYVTGALVTATVQAHGKADKVSIVKFRRRKHYLRQKGHRQPYTEIKVTGINAA